MPVIGAQDRARPGLGAGLLGKGILIVGTNAIYAYEAAAGVARRSRSDEHRGYRPAFRRPPTDAFGRRHAGVGTQPDGRPAEASTARSNGTRTTFRAVNRDGYIVDLVRPASVPPWKDEPGNISGNADEDLNAAGIEGLDWLQHSPTFEATVIDARGMPLRLVVPDPRAFAIHKLWLSERADRPALKRQRDLGQARVVGQIVARYLTHLSL